jgi:hypothetical protein
LYHTFLVQGGGLSSLIFSLALGDQEGLKFNGSNQLLVYNNDVDDDGIHVLEM